MASNMKIKKKSSEKTFDIINGAFLLILVILVAYPLYYVLIASISDPYEVYAGKTFLLPSKITFEGYKRVFKENSIAGGYLNSIYYTVLGTVVSVALVLTTGYCMSKKTASISTRNHDLLCYYNVCWRWIDSDLPGCIKDAYA